MRKIDYIVFHCSASDAVNADNIAEIRKWHKARGWSDVGYHYFIRKNGMIEKGRPLERSGSHVAGHNAKSIGVCFSGLNTFTKEQMKSAHVVLAEIEKLVGKKLPIYPHNHFTKLKTCPNFNVTDFLANKLTIILRQ